MNVPMRRNVFHGSGCSKIDAAVEVGPVRARAEEPEIVDLEVAIEVIDVGEEVDVLARDVEVRHPADAGMHGV